MATVRTHITPACRPPNASCALLSPLLSYCEYTLLLHVWYQKEAAVIFLCLKIKRDEYDTESLPVFFSMSTCRARAQQKLQAVRTNYSAIEFVQHTLGLWLLWSQCCFSNQSERAAVCFVPSAVAVCVHDAYHVYCRVLCTCHNKTCISTQIRMIRNIRNIGIS